MSQKEYDQKVIQQKIEQMLVSVGAMGELLGIVRDSLMKNGFTRVEAVAMCSQMLVGMITAAPGKGDKSNGE